MAKKKQSRKRVPRKRVTRRPKKIKRRVKNVKRKKPKRMYKRKAVHQRGRGKSGTFANVLASLLHPDI